MTAAVLLPLFGIGLVVGLLSGLLGIGGGVLVVPLLYFFYAHPGWSGVAVPREMEVAIAHATSLFIIVPTAIRGTIAYHRAGAVVWPAALPTAAVSMLSAVAGARLALHLPGEALKFGFGLLIVASAVQMLRMPDVAPHRRGRVTLARSAAAGLAVGLLSAMLGVGGGIIAIPMLIYVVGLALRQVAATSLAIVAFAATAGMATYVISGWGVPGRPPGSLGYVHVVAAVPILVGSVLAVRWGAWVNQRVPVRALRWAFAALFLILGIWLIIENGPALL